MVRWQSTRPCGSTMGHWSLPPTGLASLQTRHRGTVVGNLCNASPAADAAPALLSYGAIVGYRWSGWPAQMPLETFFQGPGRTALGPAEIVTALRLPPPQGRRGWGYARRTRTVIDIALVSACVVVQANNGVCEEVRVSLGAVGADPAPGHPGGSRPARPAAQCGLAGGSESCGSRESHPISDVRCSAEYRKDMVEVLSKRCMESACSMLQML